MSSTRANKSGKKSSKFDPLTIIYEAYLNRDNTGEFLFKHIEHHQVVPKKLGPLQKLAEALPKISIKLVNQFLTIHEHFLDSILSSESD